MLAQVFLVPHLEALVLDRVDDLADRHELAVGEDVAVDKAVLVLRALLGVGARDAVVEQAAFDVES